MFCLFQPLEQFEFFTYFPGAFWFFHFFFTNFIISFFILNSCLLFFIYFYKFSKVIPNLVEFVFETIYVFILKLVYQNIPNTQAFVFFPLYFTLFFFILMLNFIGLIPYSFTITSHFFVTFFLAFIFFLFTMVTCIYIRGVNFLKLFLPAGVENKLLFIFIVLIEVLSYFIRPFSLAIRLFANMLAGHTLLVIISGSFVYFTNLFVYLSPVSTVFFIAVLFSIFLLEFAICCIQAYVFTTLLILYMSDVYKLNH